MGTSYMHRRVTHMGVCCRRRGEIHGSSAEVPEAAPESPGPLRPEWPGQQVVAPGPLMPQVPLATRKSGRIQLRPRVRLIVFWSSWKYTGYENRWSGWHRDGGRRRDRSAGRSASWTPAPTVRRPCWIPAGLQGIHHFLHEERPRSLVGLQLEERSSEQPTLACKPLEFGL